MTGHLTHRNIHPWGGHVCGMPRPSPPKHARKHRGQDWSPLRETLKRLRVSAEPENEEAAKFRFLAPVLRALGWDVEGGTNVKIGYPTDFALIASNTRYGCVALIEAQTPGANTGNHAGTLKDALSERVNICVFTTGLEWWLYLPRESSPPESQRFASLDIRNDPIDHLVDDFRAFLGRKALSSGAAVRRAKQVLKTRNKPSALEVDLPRVWRRMTAEPNSELVELVTRQVYETVGVRPEPGQIADVLAASPTHRSEPGDQIAPGNSKPARAAKRGKRRKRRPPVPAPAAFVLWGQRHQIDKYWYEVLVGVASALYDRHPDDFGALKESTRGGRKYPIISRDQSEFPAYAKPKQIGKSGYWIRHVKSSEDIIRDAERLLKHFGYSPSDLELVYGKPAKTGDSRS